MPIRSGQIVKPFFVLEFVPEVYLGRWMSCGNCSERVVKIDYLIGTESGNHVYNINGFVPASIQSNGDVLCQHCSFRLDILHVLQIAVVPADRLFLFDE